MAGKTNVNGVVYDINSGIVNISGAIYNITGGKTLVDGAVEDIPFGPIPPSYQQVDYIENTLGIESIVSPLTFKRNLRIETTLYRTPNYTGHSGTQYCGLCSQNHYFKFYNSYDWDSDEGEYSGQCHFCFSGGGLIEPYHIINNGVNLKLFVAEPRSIPWMKWDNSTSYGPSSGVPSGMSSYDDSVIKIFEYQSGPASSQATPRPTIGGFGKITAYIGANSTIPEIELYPCIRKSDNKPGFYEPTLKTFYTCNGLTGVSLS